MDVLYLEDDKVDMEAFQRFVRENRLEYSLTTVNSIEAARKALRSKKFDLAILDYMLPDGTSLSLLDDIRIKNIPVIFATGSGSEGVAVKAMKLGADDYLIKDIDRNYLKILPSVVEETLKKKKLELEQKNLEELKRSNEELEHFAHIASHDLQEPLRMITMYVQLLEENYSEKLDDKAKKYMSYVVNGVANIKVLIDDLLEYSRVKSAVKPFEEVDCNQTVNEVLKIAANEINKTKTKLTYDKLPKVYGDKIQLAILFQNLITNAIKFRGNNSPEIHITSSSKDDKWLFSVKDNGIGIPSEYKEYVFLMFQRLHPKSKYDGSGIGLALCKKIVERHKGNIWVESEPGKGSTFYFTINK